MFQSLVPLGSEIKSRMQQFVEERTEANMVNTNSNGLTGTLFTNYFLLVPVNVMNIVVLLLFNT